MMGFHAESNCPMGNCYVSERRASEQEASEVMHRPDAHEIRYDERRLPCLLVGALNMARWRDR